MRVRFIILGILLLAPAGKLAWASDETADVQVWNALNIFLNAFDNLDWPAFRACFRTESDDVSSCGSE